MKTTKKVLAVFIAACLLVANMSGQTLMVAKAEENEVTVESLVCESVDIIENTTGWYTDEYDEETDSTIEYYYYGNIYPTFSVTFSDGTTYTDQNYNVEHNGETYWLDVCTEQCATNPWGIGTYTATAYLGDASADVTVNIIESPIVSLICEDVEILENTSGYYQTGYDSETDEEIEYFYYDNFDPVYTITFADGTVHNGNGGFEYEGEYYFPDFETGQNCMEPWGVGEHTATINVMGCEAEFTVSIVESPFASLKIDDIDIIERTHGYETSDYDWETDTYIPYYHYNYTFENAEITLKDGSKITTDSTYFIYDDKDYDIDLSAEQNGFEPWGLGAHAVTARFAGVETTYNMNIVESPYASIEVLQVASILESKDGTYNKYSIPDFSYKLTYKNSTTKIGYYDSDRYWENDLIEVSIDEETEPWSVGGDNYFTVTAPGGVSTQGKVEIKEAPPYEYSEKDGEIYFEGFNKSPGEVIEIPAEIDGKPVVSIADIGISYEQLIIPDTVRTIQTCFSYSCKEIKIGSGVTHLDAEMFENCEDLLNITISEDNPYYCSVDGVLYDKSIETLIAYPFAKGNEYTVPASVKNVDVMFYPQYEQIKLLFAEGESAFVDEDGVIYNNTKTKVLSCDTGKSGALVLPNTVCEIERYAFANCTQLTSITIPNGVTEIAYAAFRDCCSLTEVQLPDTLKTIEAFAFASCDNLKNIFLPDNLESIEGHAFAGSGLREIIIPNKVQFIGYSAFWYTPMEKLVLGTSVTTIQAYAFASTLIRELIIPDSVTSLGVETFRSCENLETITIGKGVSFIPKECFWNCSNLSKLVFLSDQVKVGDFAFDGCPIQDVNMENVKEFGQYAFSGSELKSVAIAQGVTEIAYGAFRNSTSLATIDVPETAIKIGGHVFDETAWHKEQGDGAVYIEHIFYAYNGALPSNGVVDIKEGTTVIKDYALEDQKLLTRVNLPEGLLTIGDYAFFNCPSLNEINIPASVSYIGDFVFAQCPNLTSINVDPNNPYYSSDDGVLFNKDKTELIWCPKRSDETYTVPKTVKNIQSGAFSNGENITIYIENPNTQLEKNAVGYRRIQWYDYERIVSTIACYPNSKAHEYAKANLIETTILTPKVERIEVQSMPNQTEYERGEEFNPTGLTLLVTYSDGAKRVISEGYEIGSFDSATSGQKRVTISYGDVTTDITVTVRKPTVKSVAIQTLPQKVEYYCGEQLDIAGLSLLASYSDGTDEIITTGFDVDVNMTTSGIQKVTVSYENHTTTFDITVKQAGTAIIGTTKGRAGETVEITLQFKDALDVKAMMISDVIYDSAKLQLVDGTWNVNGTLSNWDAEEESGVLAFKENTNVNTVFLTLTFKIADDAGDADIPVDCTVIAKEMFENGDEVDIKVDCITGKVIVYSVIAGDMDGNDYLSSDDAIYLLYHVMNPTKYPANQDCDFNDDGKVNSDDAIYLLYHVMLPEKYLLIN